MPTSKRNETDVEKITTAILEARKVISELHGVLKDGRALMKEIKQHMMPTHDMIGKQVLPELDNLKVQVEKASRHIHNHHQMIERTAEEDPIKAKMALLMAKKYSDVANERIAIIDFR